MSDSDKKVLEYKASHALNFENIIGFEEASWRLEKLGLELDNHIKDKLKIMNQEELFDFIQKLDRNLFFMCSYPIDLKIKTLINIKDKVYDYANGTSGDDYMSNVFLMANDYISIQTIKSSLEELTDAPLPLTQLIEQDPNLNYDSQKHLLEIKPDEQTLNSVNALLKNPLYEIRYLTIQEIYEIEQTLNFPKHPIT